MKRSETDVLHPLRQSAPGGCAVLPFLRPGVRYRGGGGSRSAPRCGCRAKKIKRSIPAILLLLPLLAFAVSQMALGIIGSTATAVVTDYERRIHVGPGQDEGTPATPRDMSYSIVLPQQTAGSIPARRQRAFLMESKPCPTAWF